MPAFTKESKGTSFPWLYSFKGGRRVFGLLTEDSGNSDTQGNRSFQLTLLQAAVVIFVQAFCVPGWDNAASIFLLRLSGVYTWRVLKAGPYSIYPNYWDHTWFFSLQTLPTLATVELHTALAFGKHMASEENFL